MIGWERKMWFFIGEYATKAKDKNEIYGQRIISANHYYSLQMKLPAERGLHAK